MTNESLTGQSVRMINREDHFHLDQVKVDSESQIPIGSAYPVNKKKTEPEKWVELQQQKLIFDGEECVVVSLRDISTTHEL